MSCIGFLLIFCLSSDLLIFVEAKIEGKIRVLKIQDEWTSYKKQKSFYFFKFSDLHYEPLLDDVHV